MGMSTVQRREELSWDVEPDELTDDDGQLTELVRNWYLRHLEKCLKTNVASSSQKLVLNDEDFVSRQAHLLERRALRACMRVGIYRRTMVGIIEEVKRSTDKTALYSMFLPEIDGETTKHDKETQTTEHSPDPKPTDNGIDSYEELLNILMSSPADAAVVESPKPTLKRKLDESRINLDDRLHQLGLLEEKPKRQQPPKIVPLPVDWSVELSAQLFHLHHLLSQMSPEKRARVESRLEGLFGRDEPVSNTASDETQCRKRIASFVVGELTPHYVLGKIASREVFKNLAKKITDRFLSITLAPDPSVIKQYVDHIFELKPQINNHKDINLPELVL